MPRRIGKQSGIHVVSPEEGKKGYIEEDLQKRKVLSLEWKSDEVMDDESGELMEPMEEITSTKSDEFCWMSQK